MFYVGKGNCHTPLVFDMGLACLICKYCCTLSEGFFYVVNCIVSLVLYVRDVVNKVCLILIL
jgi:hypothetical protein